MANIVYIKKVDEYDDVLKEKHKKNPKFFKEIIFMYKNIFNIITKKKVENENIWILPLQEKYSKNKINKIIKKISTHRENIYVVADNLANRELYKLMDKYNILYLNGKELKKYLVIKILEYINKIQNKEINNIEVTILANDTSEFNIYLIEKISKMVKGIKVISSNIYKFKNLEEKIYNDYGLAIQFSNSYKKSLFKSKLIINLDYNKIDINEYQIFDKAIIINCAEDDIKIKSKIFNGIIINSCDIKFKKEIRDKFKDMNIYYNYNNLLLYSSIIQQEKNFDNIFKKIDEDKVIITNLIGNNGVINKNEFKNIFKKLDK